MKFIAGIIIAALGGGLIGSGIEKALASQRRMSSGSVAGKTLAGLYLALELEKQRAGAFPEAISGLQVSGGPEFSQSMLQQVVYRKTTKGYVAFIGHPHVVYIEHDMGPHFE